MSNPIGSIDPTGLHPESYYECILSNMSGMGPTRFCDQILFASAYETLEASCSVAVDGVTCVAECVAKQLIGSDFKDFVFNVHKKSDIGCPKESRKGNREQGNKGDHWGRPHNRHRCRHLRCWEVIPT